MFNNKETLLTCGKLKSDCLNKTKAQISTFEFKSPASDYKIKIIIESCVARFVKWSDVDINPYLYFSVSHALFSGLLKKKMRRRFGKDWEIRNKISRGKRKYFYRQPRERKINLRERIWRYTARNKPVEKITGYRRLGKTRRD